jgi:magnesium-transporting ATPase (P-type)
MNSHHPIWAIAAEDVYNNLTTAVGGLNDAEADLRIKQYGYNELPKPQTRPLILRFVDQLTHFMALLLWVAGILAFVSQTPELGWAIWAVIWINAIFSFSQEFQAEKALAALKQVLPSQVKVFRNGELCLLPARELVTGDVIQLEEGDKISADARLVESQSFYVDVSILTALLVAAIKAGFDLQQLQQQTPRIHEIPFDSHRRMMTVLLESTLPEANSQFLVINSQLKDPTQNLGLRTFTKGAPLDVLQHCRYILQSDGQEELTEAQRGEIEDANDELASLGYRVLGVATHQGGEELRKQDNESLEQNLTFIGLVAMIDPARPEVSRAIALCHRAGIQVTMITGDYGLTASAIAQKIGLISGKSKAKSRVITGEQLGHLSQAQLRQILHKQKQGLVFARVMPEQKLRLVKAYQDLGHVVAVTGDGVNDAPALRAANIGIAMGMNGTDVAREAADIVLVDDNFATIVEAIEQGRSVYQNIRKFMTYILASNMAEFLPFLAMVFLKIPPALIILQILAIDLGTDMLPALALGAERPEKGSMEQPPRQKSKALLDLPLMLRAYCFLGLIEGLAGMAGFFLIWWSNGYGITQIQAVTPSIISHSATASTMAIYHQATTVTLAVIVACQDGNVFACRSERVSIFRLGLFSNRLIWLGIAIEWVLILSIIYSPTLQKIFMTEPLEPLQLLALLVCPPLVLMADELRKRFLPHQKALAAGNPVLHPKNANLD